MSRGRGMGLMWVRIVVWLVVGGLVAGISASIGRTGGASAGGDDAIAYVHTCIDTNGGSLTHEQLAACVADGKRP